MNDVVIIPAQSSNLRVYGAMHVIGAPVVAGAVVAAIDCDGP